MDALLMCGGRGTRLDADVEKPLFEVGGDPMIDRVRAALEASRVETAHAVVSPNAPATRAHVDSPTIETPGEGYVEDLDRALSAVDLPVLTVAADLPLLAGEVIDRVLDAHAEVHGANGDGSLTVCVPAELKRLLGVSLDTTMEHDGRDLAPTGVNVVGRRDDPDAVHRSYDARLAVNVNRREDATIAEGLL